MTDHQLDYDAHRARELMLRVARNPRISCCCIKLSWEDRRRAWRVFRLTRRISRDEAIPGTTGRGFVG
ncbi:MAG: hypothetical protein WC807_06025 [Hyphomicrobium sp.]|jgi:hypothetical protein